MLKMKATKKLYSNIRKIFLVLMVLFPLLGLASCGDQHLHSYNYNNNETIHWQECSCGEKKNEEDHIFGDWITTKEPTISSVGSKKRVCGICQYEQIEVLDPKEPEETKGLEYSLNEDKKSYTVVGIGSATDETELVIPSTYQNLPVEQIAKDCFADNKNLKSVTLSKNIIYIDSRGFSNCLNIENVYYLGTLEDWCKITFQSMTSNPLYTKSSLYLRNPLGTLEKVTQLDIPNGVKEIKSFAFPRLKDLTDVLLPEGIQEIGQYAFYKCPKLSCIELPKSLTLIENDAFSIDSDDNYYENEPSILRTIKYNGTLEEYCNIDIWNAYASPLQNAKTVYMVDGAGNSIEIKTLEIPDSLTEVKECLFFGWSGLTEVVLPTSIKSIKSDAFEKCLNLERIYYKGDKESWQKVSIEFNREITDEKLYYYSNSKPTQSGNYWHYTNDKIMLWENTQEEQHNYSTEWTVDQEATCTGNGSKSHHCLDCDQKKDITEIPALGHQLSEKYSYDSTKHWKKCERCQTILDESSHTYNHAEICSICLYDPKVGTEGLEYTLNEDGQSYSVTGIGTVTSSTIVIPSMYNGLPITRLKNSAFSNCEFLVTLILGENIEMIEADISIDSLKSLYIGKYVKEVLSNCSFPYFNLTNIYYEGTIEDWCKIQINRCCLFSYTSLSNHFYIRNSNNEWEEVTSIEIPNTITEIGYAQFFCFTNIKSITLSNTITSIGQSAFYCCISLTSIVIPDSVTSIGESAFVGCVKLIEIYNLSNLKIEKGSNENGQIGMFAVAIHSQIEPSELLEINGFIFVEVDGGYSLVAYRNDDTDLVLPTDVNGNEYGIRPYAFVMTPITSITIPDGVTSIGQSAFYNCSSLTSITIGNSVTSIGQSAFYNCSSLTSIEIPNSVTSIEDYAFYNCSSLTSIVIPDSVTSIGRDAFYNCSSLTSIVIPDSVTSIGRDAFSGCSSLENVYYEGTIEDWCKISLGSGSSNPMNYANHFYLRNSNNEWEEVTSIDIPEGVTEIGRYQFYGFNNVKSIIIPNSVISIGSYAFSGCSSLTSIEIPNSVTSIGQSAFDGCSSLENVYYEGTIEDWCKISLDYGSNPMNYANHFYLRNSNNEWEEVTSIDIPNTITKIGTYQFYGFNNVVSITIPDSVTSIGYDAFEDCSNIIKATLPTIAISTIPKDKLQEVIITGGTSIGYRAFYNCSSLTSIEIPNSVTSIGESAFSGCSSLKYNEYDNALYLGNEENPYLWLISAKDKTITTCEINENTKHIYYNAFSGCSSLESIIMPFVGASKDGTSNTHFGYIFGARKYIDNSEYIPSSLKEVIITGGTSIGDYAFSGCSSLTSIVIPNSVTSIGWFAFYNCSSLESITIPFVGASKDGTSNTHFGYIFGDGSYSPHERHVPSSLKEVIITGGTSIGRFAFYECSSLTSIVILNGVTSIGDYAFSGCSSLTSIVIPNSVTSIGSPAFYNCSSLENVYYEGTIEDWCKISLGDDSSNPMSYANHFYLRNSNNEWEEVTSINIPNTITEIGTYQFYGFNNVTSITIPDSVTSIGESAFDGCSSLKYNEYDNALYLGNEENPYLCLISAKDKTITTCEINENTKHIYYYAFYCSSLTNIVIPDSVKSIGESAFSGCSSLTNVTIGNSVTSIGYSAFSGCNLKEVYYTGTSTQWDAISIDSPNPNLISATRYYYSETQPTSTGYYWHYVNGVPTKW